MEKKINDKEIKEIINDLPFKLKKKKIQIK